MRIATNEQIVESNKKTATRLFFFSLLILLAGFLLANGSAFGLIDPELIDGAVYLFGMPLILLVGFITTMISVRMTNIWVRVPRPEDAIEEGLKGISNKSALYHYFHLPARHVLICPQGIFAIVTRFQDGKIVAKNGRWRIKRNIISQILSAFRFDSLGDPQIDAEDAADHIRYLIEDYDPDIPVYPVIVFHDPRAELFLDDPDIPAVYADPKREPNLRDYVRDKDRAEQFDTNEKLTAFITEFEEYTV